MTLETYDFVQATGRDRYFEARDREMEVLRGPDGKIRPEYAEPVAACPVCSSRDHVLWFEKQGFEIRRCQNDVACGHIFAHPQIKEGPLLEAYRGPNGGDGKFVSANDLWIDVLLSQVNRSYDRTKFENGLQAIRNALETDPVEKPRVLDVGCSIGHFLETARKHGWDAIGLELNEKATRHAREVLGLDVRRKTLEKAGFEPESFDAVTMWGVVEHLKRPVDTLKEVTPLLKPGGVFLTFSPNGDSLVCSVLRDKAATFDGRNHPSYFTPQSIRLAVETAGMANLSIDFFQPDLDALVHYCEGRDPYMCRTDQYGPLHRFFSETHRAEAEKFILENGLGYKMMTVNRKERE